MAQHITSIRAVNPRPPSEGAASCQDASALLSDANRRLGALIAEMRSGRAEAVLAMAELDSIGAQLGTAREPIAATLRSIDLALTLCERSRETVKASLA